MARSAFARHRRPRSLFTDGMFMTEQPGAVALARDRLYERARDPRVVDAGLADDLRMIGEAFDALDGATRLLARVFLSNRYGYVLSQPEYQALATLAAEVAPGFYAERVR
jgi:hypothetical protein